MDTITIVAITVAVLVIAAVVGYLAYQRQQSSRLQRKFGAEYERTVEETEDRRSAEKTLIGREKRRSEFEVTPLSADQAADFRAAWAEIQQDFVDQPAESVRRADVLVVRVMREMGYPVDDFEQRVGDISVDHPTVAQHYREAHTIAAAQAEGRADTEELRQAVTSYRQLVDALLDGSADGPEFEESHSEESHPTETRSSYDQR